MWNACSMEPSAALRWVECHPGLAAWVQAVGTIAAVLLAIAVPTAVEFVARRGRARRLDHVTGAAFLRLRRALVNLHCESDLRAQWLKRLPADISGMLGRIWLEDMQIPISRHLTQAEPSGLRPDFSKALLLSIESAAQFNSWVTKLREYPEEFFPSQWASMRRLMQDIAMKVCEHAATALKIGHPIAG